MKAEGRSQLWLPLLVAFLLFGVPYLAELYADWLWFGETGYRQVFARSLAARIALAAVVWAGAFVFLYANARRALRDLRRREFTIATELGPKTVVAGAEGLKRLVYGAAALGALALGLYASARWESALLYWTRRRSGSRIPCSPGTCPSTCSSFRSCSSRRGC